MKIVFLLILICFLGFSLTFSQSLWQSSLDSRIQFYHMTDFGILLVGTEQSLYALDAKTGEKLWRRSVSSLDETAITPVPGTDLILISIDEGEKSRLEAVDLLSGERLWLSNKIKGDVMQLATDSDLVAVISVKKAYGKVGQNIERKPIVYVFRLSDGEELWKKELSSSVQMMPSRFDSESEVPFTLDNYRPPLMLDGRLYLFYEGVTSYDAQSGDAREKDEFKVNESGLALTEADPIFDDKYLYVSGRGKVRAVNRKNFKVEWEAKDLGVTSEMAAISNILYVRT
ncbi:MAG: PQQ-binding-like beta-propeller repeat protein, partial [Pyrinomonadaceae bacterium]